MDPSTRQVFIDSMGEPRALATVVIGLFIASLFVVLMYVIIQSKNEMTDEQAQPIDMFLLIAKMLMLILVFAVLFKL